MEKLCSFFLFRQLADLINQGGAPVRNDLPEAVEMELQQRAARAYDDRCEAIANRERAVEYFYARAR